MSKTIVDILVERSAATPDHVPYVFYPDDSGTQYTTTYALLDQQARYIAAHLQHRFTGGERVLLLYSSGFEFMPAFLGCLYAGLIAVPAPAPNIKSGNLLTRTRSIVADSTPRLILTSAEIRRDNEATFRQKMPLEQVAWWTTPDCLKEPSAAWHVPSLAPNDIAYLQYTSGSTSDPKGVMVSHGNIIHNCGYIYEASGYTLDSSTATWGPYYHDQGLLIGLLHPIYSNTVAHLLQPVTFIRNPLFWLEIVSQERVTHIRAPNFAYDYCVRKISAEQRLQLDLSNLCCAVNGAEHVRPDTIRNFNSAFAVSGLSATALAPAYGLAEATLSVSMKPISKAQQIRQFVASELDAGRAIVTNGEDARTIELVSLGPAVGATKIVIVDPETHQQQPDDYVGEIWLADPSIALGYWGNELATSKMFRAKIAGEDEACYLRTGDLGFLHAGELYFTERLKDMLVIRGQNYYPQDVEVIVEQSHPAIRRNLGAAFVVGRLGGETLAIAYEISLKYAEQVAEVAQAMRNAVSATHQLQVQMILLLPPQSMPKTSSGKVQRFACKQAYLANRLNPLYESSLNQPAEGASVAESALPATSQIQIEQEVVAIWTEVLGVASIGVHENFFELGGSSLTMITMLSQIRTQFGKEISANTFLQASTVAGMVEYLQDAAVGRISAEKSHVDIVQRLFSGRTMLSSQPTVRQRLQDTFVPLALRMKLIHFWSRSRWVHRTYFFEEQALIQRLLVELGCSAQLTDAALTRHLTRRLVDDYARGALRRSVRRQIDRWVDVDGRQYLEEALRAGNGVIVASLHTLAPYTLPRVILDQLNGQEHVQMTGPHILTEAPGYLNIFKGYFGDDNPQTVAAKFLSAQYDAARLELERGGMVHIVADGGFGGGKSLELPFLGRQRVFRTGFAHLALDTGATVIPMSLRLQMNGQLKLRFEAAFDKGPETISYDERTVSLVQQYCDFMSQVWLEEPANLKISDIEEQLRARKSC